jgi:methyl acetate hydrolase
MRISNRWGMTDTTFELTDPMRRKLAGIHAWNAVGSLTPMDCERPAKAEAHMGGHRLYGTVGDYMRFYPGRDTPCRCLARSSPQRSTAPAVCP